MIANYYGKATDKHDDCIRRPFRLALAHQRASLIEKNNCERFSSIDVAAYLFR